MTDKDFYDRIDDAKKSHNKNELIKLSKKRSFDFYNKMIIKEFNGYDKLALYIAAIKVKETYGKFLSKEMIEAAEEVAENIQIGGSFIMFDVDAIKKAGDINGL